MAAAWAVCVRVSMALGRRRAARMRSRRVLAAGKPLGGRTWRPRGAPGEVCMRASATEAFPREEDAGRRRPRHAAGHAPASLAST